MNRTPIKWLALSGMALVFFTGCASCGYDWNCSSASIRKTSAWKKEEACFNAQRSMAIEQFTEQGLTGEMVEHISRECARDPDYQWKRDPKFPA